MAELADAQDLESCPRGCRFKSCYPHQKGGGATNSPAFFIVYEIYNRTSGNLIFFDPFHFNLKNISFMDRIGGCRNNGAERSLPFTYARISGA